MKTAKMLQGLAAESGGASGGESLIGRITLATLQSP